MEEMQKITEYKSNAMKWKIGIALFVLLLGVGGYYFFAPKERKGASRYVTHTLERGELTMTVSVDV